MDREAEPGARFRLAAAVIGAVAVALGACS